jgi:predicted nucleotidyltransferase
MLPLIETHRSEIAALCRRFHVRRLDVFGSAARGTDFDPARSDVDMLVAYEAVHASPTFAEFLALRDALSGLLGRPVDLVMADGVENPFVRADIERYRQPLYAA